MKHIVEELEPLWKQCDGAKRINLGKRALV
jgi:hypothetical protein